MKKPVTEDHILDGAVYERSRIGKITETEGALVAVLGWKRGDWGVTAPGYGFFTF